jgi:hypothetical protein
MNGRMISRYRVAAELGRGGTGVVYSSSAIVGVFSSGGTNNL